MRGLVLPPVGPGRWTSWDRDRGLLRLLYREIGCESAQGLSDRHVAVLQRLTDPAPTGAVQTAAASAAAAADEPGPAP